MYPITQNAELVKPDQVAAYLGALFRYVEWEPGQYMAFRGIGEGGTAMEGQQPISHQCEPASQDATGVAVHLCRLWAQHHRTGFVIPAVVGDPHHAREEDVRLFTAIVVDIDKGDIDAKREWVSRHLGPPTMAVRSGGVSETGQPKVHLYWRLTEPSDEIQRVALLREVVAVKIGGDSAFKRPTQPIRIAGSVHCKGGGARPVDIAELGQRDYELDDLAEAIDAMPPMPGCEAPPKALVPYANGVLDFSGVANGGSLRRSVDDALTTPVHAGGDPGASRWDAFNQVAGHHIRMAREGRYDLNEAAKRTHEWMTAEMRPPWPWDRFESEFKGQIQNDIRHHGEWPGTPVTVAPMAVSRQIKTVDDLLSWSVIKRSTPNPAARRFLVEGLIQAGKKHAFVAEGGAGKTYAMMDLALKLAASGPDMPDLEWLGQKIRPEAWGGTVVMLTAEDDMAELDIRWNAIDPGGRLRQAAGDRLIVLPLDDIGGAFPLVSTGRGNDAAPSPRWLDLYRLMAALHASGRWLSAAVIDTYNATLHGDENSATVTSEYVRAVTPITGELGAALIITHHVRKANKEPVRDPEDMLNAIRGSNALPSAMRVTIGLWHAHDWNGRMEAMGERPRPKQCYRLAVVKGNNPELLSTVKTLLRAEGGALMDATRRDTYEASKDRAMKAFLVLAIRQAAADGFPFTKTSTTTGVFARRASLPKGLRNMSKHKLPEMVEELIKEGRVVPGNVQKGGKSLQFLDVPGGILAEGHGTINNGSWKSPDWMRFEFDPELGDVFLRPDAVGTRGSR